MELFYRIFRGVGKDIHKPKEPKIQLRGPFDWIDYYVLYLLGWFRFYILTALDWLDTEVFFKGRRVRTNKGRVRSFAERRITRFFEKHSIDYEYEKTLTLDGIKTHPDFYLPKYGVYVEFWGLVRVDSKYSGVMIGKKRLYEKHKIPVISLYPKHFRNLEDVFPELLRMITGKEFPSPAEKEKGGVHETGGKVGVVGFSKNWSRFLKGRKTMRTIAAIVILAVVGVVGGFWLLGGHVSQWMRDAKTAVDQASSDSHIIGMHERNLSEAERKLKKVYVDVYQAKIKASEIEGTLNVQKENLNKEEKIFKRANELLVSFKPGSKIRIGPASFTWEEVNEDVLRRVGLCKILRGKIAANEQMLLKLRKAYDDGMEMIRQMKDELMKEQIRFEADKIDLVVLRELDEINAVVGKVYSHTDIRIGPGDAKKEFDRRLNEARAKAEFDEKIGPKTGVVTTWNVEVGIPSENAVDAIKDYFETAPSEQKTSEEQKAPVGEALENLPEKKDI